MNIEKLYRQDIASIPDWRKIPREEQRKIVERARHGDYAACEEVILGLLPYTLAYATKIQGRSILAMDLVSVGSVAILEYFERALPMENPAGYLLKSAVAQMYYYKRRYSNAITMPTAAVGDTPYEVCTIIDCDSDEFVQTSPPEEVQDDHSPLHEALASLSESKKTLLVRLFGLYEEPQEDLADIAGGNAKTAAYKTMEHRRRRYLKTCLCFIEKYHRDYMTKHTSEKAKSIPRYVDIAVPEKTFKKLEEARKALEERGENVSALKLTKTARVHSEHASAYLYQIRKAASSAGRS